MIMAEELDYSGPAHSVAFSPTDEDLLGCSGDGVVMLMSLSQQDVKRVLKAITPSVKSVQGNAARWLRFGIAPCMNGLCNYVQVHNLTNAICSRHAIAHVCIISELHGIMSSMPVHAACTWSQVNQVS